MTSCGRRSPGGGAAASGQYALAGGDQPAPPAPADRDAIARLLRYTEDCEAGWGDWFTTHAIAPFEIAYEDMTRELATTERELATYLGVALPPGRTLVRPRLRRHADQHTERLMGLFTARAECDRPGQWGDGTGSGRANVR